MRKLGNDVIATEGHLAVLFPKENKFTGEECDFTFGDKGFGLYFGGHYSRYEIERKLVELQHADTLFERFKDLFERANLKIHDIFGSDMGELSSDTLVRLRWEFMLMIQLEDLREGPLDQIIREFS